METMEVSIADGIRHLYIPYLNAISSSLPMGIRGWLAGSNHFIPHNGQANDCFEITLYDINEFIQAWAGDVVRLSSASLETVNNISESIKSKKFLAWQLVQYYYSAFYAAHATLKICSFGLVQIDNNIISNIKRVASSCGNRLIGQINKGLYCVELNPSQSKVVFYKIKRYDDSHRGLWNRYADFIDVLRGISVVTGSHDSMCVRAWNGSEPLPKSVYSQLPRSDAEVIVQRLELVKKTMDIRGDNNWLSSVRNNINYNQNYGVWFPYKEFQSKYDKLVSMSSLYMNMATSDVLKYDHGYDLEEFVKCCQIIMAINRELLIDLESRHPSNKSFLKSGPIYLINLYNS